MRAIELWSGYAAATRLVEDTPPRPIRRRQMILPEFAYAILIKPYKAGGISLPVGAKGTVLSVFPNTETYTIEFFEPVRTVETVPMNIVSDVNAQTT